MPLSTRIQATVRNYTGFPVLKTLAPVPPTVAYLERPMTGGTSTSNSLSGRYPEVPAPLRRSNSPYSTQARLASLYAAFVQIHIAIGGVGVERRDAVVHCILLGCGREVYVQRIR